MKVLARNFIDPHKELNYNEKNKKKGGICYGKNVMCG